MIDFTEYIGFFEFLTSWWEVKMIKFTEYIELFSTSRYVNLLLGSQND